ncbi:MAG TPA: TIGR02266 family protein [Bdellovibrionota bacterium]|nr:TIGR02266 family protein [Bdellovibrionota bacterium]
MDRPPSSETGKPRIPTPTETKEPERRRELRIPMRVLRVEAEREGEVFFGYAANLSVTGLFIQTTNPKPVGTQVHVAFTLPKAKEKITSKAEIVWVQEYAGKDGPSPGMGLRFLEPPDSTLAAIRKFIEGTSE